MVEGALGVVHQLERVERVGRVAGDAGRDRERVADTGCRAACRGRAPRPRPRRPRPCPRAPPRPSCRRCGTRRRDSRSVCGAPPRRATPSAWSLRAPASRSADAVELEDHDARPAGAGGGPRRPAVWTMHLEELLLEQARDGVDGGLQSVGWASGRSSARAPSGRLLGEDRRERVELPAQPGARSTLISWSCSSAVRAAGAERGRGDRGEQPEAAARRARARAGRPRRPRCRRRARRIRPRSSRRDGGPSRRSPSARRTAAVECFVRFRRCSSGELGDIRP